MNNNCDFRFIYDRNLDEMVQIGNRCRRFSKESIRDTRNWAGIATWGSYIDGCTYTPKKVDNNTSNSLWEAAKKGGLILGL